MYNHYQQVKLQVNEMRDPVKRLKLYEMMKSDIASGNYPPGSFLPNEFELAEKYGCARGTVRSTLTMLEDDNLFELLKGKGRRICATNSNKAKVPLTFLLPCPGFITDAFPDISVQNTLRMLEGVSRIAFEYDYRMETVPVSPTNNKHDIDWRKLDFVNAESLLVINGDWYRDLFPLLLERGCRVVLVNSHISHRKQDAQFLNSCFQITLNALKAAELAVESLFRHGFRRIALFHHSISEPEHPIMRGYLSGLRKCELAFTAWHNLPDVPMKLETVKSQLKDFYRKSGGFDSLIISPGIVIELRLHNLYKDLGLDEDIKVIVSNDSANNQLVTPSLTSIAFPYEGVGRIAAQHLLSPEFSPGEQLINAQLIERESTLALKSDFALA